MQPLILFTSSPNTSNTTWRVVDDGVMGGKSQGHAKVTEAGHLHFYGEVSLENNGGFSSVRYDLPKTQNISGYTKVVMRLKGDGIRFQFRLKAQANQRYSHIQYFETSGEWEEVQLPLRDFYASFRGRKLDLPNFEADQLEEITFLIANKKAQDFSLKVAEIRLE